MSVTVTTNTASGVCELTLSNPKRANSLSSSMCSQLLDALDRAERDVNVRVVVITGEGKYFCSGMDLGAASAGTSAPFDSGLALFSRIARFPKPTSEALKLQLHQHSILFIPPQPLLFLLMRRCNLFFSVAKVNGPALGGGVGLLFCTDIRVADETAYVQLAEVRRGLIPAIISLFIVPQLGPSLSRQYFLTGEKVPVATLARQGIVAASVPADQLASKVSEFVALLAAGGPGAQATIKQLIDCVSGATAATSSAADGADDVRKREHVRKVFEGMMTSEEAAYGWSTVFLLRMQAFLTKQTPDWVAFTKENSSKL
ncbi:hypothetical protein HDU84_005707 [Entophlyctis sp. JEL0112]|nr:hypothetical protein HDU84_005707 [Entophlyctis sp. JEL0112]